MFKKNKNQAITREELNKYHEETQGLERDMVNEILNSRSRAWKTATAFFVFAVVSMVTAVGVIIRFAQPLPAYLTTINKDTGEVSQVKITRDEATYGDVIDQYWISQFVIHRESYDFNSIQVDYDAMSLMAAGEVADEYLSMFKGPNRIDKRLGDSERTTVHINSVITDRAHGVATVRFTTQQRIRQRPNPEPPRYWIATIAYEYKALPMTAQQRYINPLGFRVTSYRKNAENVGTVGG
ncbi:TPA: type IV secretion system protein [Klebsiella pneumoniae]|nr:type IV secretion system protein [Klebsiella pneumoniae]